MDLTDHAAHALTDPHLHWARLRSVDPVSWHPEEDGPGFWSVTRYADAARILRDPASFSSERGMMLGVNRGSGDPAAGRMLVVTDPPRHTHLRRLVQAHFTADSISRLHHHVRSVAVQLVDRALAMGSCDFVHDVAAPLPVAVICHLLGVPRADWPVATARGPRLGGAGRFHG